MVSRIYPLFLAFIFVFPFLANAYPFKAELLEKENEKIAAHSAKMKDFYELSPGETIKDITAQVLAHPTTKQESKDAILAYQRRIYVFNYPSDGLQIKGTISLTPHHEGQPLLVLFRSGNRDFALFNPGLNLATYRDYTVISSTLRGGVSEGQDEFGGRDVRDMKHLLDFLPTLARELQISLNPSATYLLGPSRGGLEMFLLLARYPEVQNQVDKVVALSAILDLNRQIADRPDNMKQMFITDFGLREGVNEEEWIQQRNPLLTVPLLKKSLPILIIQGTADPRIHVAEGHEMVKRLQETEHDVTYWEIEGGTHMLSNFPHLMDSIAGWLESP